MEQTPGERLEIFLKYKNISFDEFVRQIGFDKLVGQADKYIGSDDIGKKKSVMRKNKTDKFSVIGLNSTWYLTGFGDMILKKNESNVKFIDHNFTQETYTREIPFITVTANAGEGFSFDDIPEAYIKESFIQYPASCKKLKIYGDSMYPIKSGSIVTFDESIKPNSGDMVIAIVNGVLYFKTFEIKNGHKYLVSTNKDYEDIPLNGFGEWKILGKVIAYSEK